MNEFLKDTEKIMEKKKSLLSHWESGDAWRVVSLVT